MTTALRSFGISHQAERQTNDDMFCAEPKVFAVADGIGARSGAAVASRTAIASLARRVSALDAAARLDDDRLRELVQAVNDDVIAQGERDPALHGLGTTLSALVVEDGQGRIIHLGDSQAYHFRDGTLTRLTRAHTVANDLVEMQRLDPSQVDTHPLRSMLSRFLGSPNDAVPDIIPVALAEGDCVVLATDGLTSVFGDADLERACREQLGRGVEALCRHIADEALTRGPGDNVTVVALHASGR